MRLSDIFDALGSGELANLHLVENNTIIPDKLPIVLNAINLALTDLHTKFLLKRELVKISIEPTIETYKITNGDFKSEYCIPFISEFNTVLSFEP